MKMKKTQSLKLMLVGLLSFMGINAWAEGEVYTGYEGIVYEVSGDNAYVAGVLAGAGSNIKIADKVADKFVVGFTTDWKKAARLSNGVQTVDAGVTPPAGGENADGSVTETSSTAGTTSTEVVYNTVDATKLEGVYLLVRASKITALKADIADLKIETFTLGQGCGYVNIEDFLFAPTKPKASERRLGERTAKEGEISAKENEIANFKNGEADMRAQYDTWSAEVAKREKAVTNAKKQAAYKEEVGILKGLNDQLKVWKNLQKILTKLATTWSTVSTKVKAAVAEGTDANLDDNQKAIYAQVVAAMDKTDISQNGNGGYDIPDWQEVADRIEDLELNQIPEQQTKVDGFLFNENGIDNDGGDQYTLAQLEQRLEEAKAELAKYDYDGKLKTLEDELAKLREDLAALVDDEIILDAEGKNELLGLVSLYNQLESVGESSFANCVNATFRFGKNADTDKVPASIVKGGFKTNAFLNTQFKNLDLSLTGTLDYKGATDSEGKPIPNGKIDADELFGDANIADDAFKNTPLERAVLATTNLGNQKVKKIFRNIKFEELEIVPECEEWLEEGFDNKVIVNKTLTYVELPDATTLPEDVATNFTEIFGRDRNENGVFTNMIELPAITIPAQVTKIGTYAFMHCIKLANITFAQVKSQLETIESYAFYGTAAEWISLQKQTKLSDLSYRTSGPRPQEGYQFAYMPNLKGVNISYTQLTTLPPTVFYGSEKLYGVTFFDANPAEGVTPEETTKITSLPKKLFMTNAIKNLDLSKTGIKNLENLFYAGPGDVKGPKWWCNGVYQGEPILNPVNTTLESIILPENLQTIECFALASLQNANFKTVEIPSTVTWMGDAVFYNDANLEVVKFMETKLTGFYARTFSQCAKLKEVYFVSVNGAYPELFGQPTGDDIMWNTYWTLQDGMITCQSEDSTTDDVIGFGDNLFFSCGSALVNVYVTDGDYEKLCPKGGYTEGVGSYSKLIPYQMGIQLTMEADLNGEHYYWGTFSSPYAAWFDSTKDDLVIYSAYQMGNDIVLYPAKIKGPGKEGWYKVAAFDPTIDWYLPVVEGNGRYWTQAKVTGNDAASVCIIRSKSNTVNPKLYTDEVRKFQTTLDVENILTVAREDIEGSTNLNYYVMQANGTKLRFKHVTEASKIIQEGQVCIKTEADQGYGSRDFFNVVVVEANEATAIQGVKEYMNGIQSGAIFNLKGVRVSAPVKGQMYIQNGKKFIQK